MPVLNDTIAPMTPYAPAYFHPLSRGQQALWFLYQMAPESVAYNIFDTALIRSPIDITGLHRAWQKIVNRHSILRTTYTTHEGKPFQVIQEYLEGSIQVTDTSNWSEDYLKKQILLETDRPFNLEKELPWRLNLFTLSPQEYILLLTMHHIASDSWSYDLLFTELQLWYAAETEQLSPQQVEDSLPKNLPYTDFVNWQSEMLSSPKAEKHWEYWQKQLSGELPILNLPTDRPRPPIQSFRGGTHLFQLDEKLIKGLKEVTITTSTTLYKLMLTAFFVLLYRYTNQEDILVGSPMLGRSGREFKGVVGYFVNPAVLRASISGNLTFQDLLAQVSTQVKAAQKHQDYPFPLLVEQLQPQRDPSRSPLFQVSFTWQKQRWCESGKELGLKMEPYPLGHQRGASSDLDVMMMEMGEVLLAGWQYNTDLFDASTIARMAGHYQTLLEAIALNPEQRISELPLLTPADRHQLLVEWNNTRAEYPQDKCIHQLFEEQVRLTPDAIAVVFEGEQLTYRELNAKANQLAHYLQSLGVGPEVLVGICVERSFEMIVGILGILKAGGAYVPIDPNYPSDRLAFMLEDSSVPVLLTQQKLVEKLPPNSAHVITLDSDWEEIAAYSEKNPSRGVKPENLAYVIYTSGSTGKPKGVLIEHRSLVNYTIVASAEYGIQERDHILQFSSISFDVSAEEIYTSLISGATLVLRTDTMLDSVEVFLQKCSNWEITVMALPTAYWHELTIFLSQEKFTLPSSLRLIIIGGEKALPERLKTWFECVGQQIRLVNNYGPTETTVGATICELSAADATLRELPIGRPMGNVQTYILDGNRQPVPIGVPGELHIGGAGLARGYLNRPELTDERFIPNPFSDSPTERLYKTGDLVRYLRDGNIEYLGRIDNQVKIRGFRIELGEIEAVLSQHPHVRETVVIASENITGGKQLVAYVVPHQQSAPSISDLRRFLKEQLPDYMMPSAFVVLEALPLTPNGKVDRRALRTPEKPNEREESFVAPRTPIEEMLASIWENILSIDPVGIHDNFFELGGHSLLATQVISRVRDTFAVELPLRSLFEAPTVAGLAERVENSLKNVQSGQALPLVPIPKLGEIPLSFAQARLWFLDQLQPNSAFYNLPLALRLSGLLNIAALESSINEIIQRHEALRTNFVTAEGQPVQVIASSLNCQVQVVNLLHLPESERESEAQRCVNQEANRPFNLEREPLFRVTLLQLDQTEYVCLFTMHHIISDGWSLGVFVKELTELYKGFSIGKPANLPLLPLQYADFAVWQRQWLTGEILKTQLDYWKKQLSDAPDLLELPTDRPRPAVQTFRGGYYHAVLPQELNSELTALSKRVGVTLFMTLLAAFQTLLYRLSGQDDIVVGTPVAGRNQQEIEGLVGFFVNTLVLRIDFSGNPSFEQLLNRVREVALQAYAHQELPFEQLVEALHPTRDLSYTPLFQVMFSLDDDLVPSVKLPELLVSSYPVEIGTAKFDLGLSMENTASGLVAEWEYNPDLFDESTIARIAKNFQTLLEGIVVNSKQSISELPLLTPAERHQIHVEWNNTWAEYPQDKCIHQLFEEQVDRSPDAVAVVFEGEQLTYGELNVKANQLAHYLRSLGVGPEVLVGLYVERSFDTIVGMLGILKAGSAYVPLDPAYPEERLGFMLEDSSVPVLLTQTQLVELLPPSSARVVCVDGDIEKIAFHSSENPSSRVTPDNLAYVIYTSGSTGKPKGVLLAHQGLCNLATAQIQLFGVHSESRILQFASFSFDASVSEIVMALISGATLVLAKRESLMPGPALIGLLREEAITTVTLPPSVLAVLPPEEFPALQTIIVAGEACPPDLVGRWASGRQFFNAYGPTEATVCATVALCSDGSQKPTIGRPIANTQIYILDPHNQPVPIGVPGELHIAGVGLAKGYLNRPDLTDEKFVPNPFSNKPDSRLYKTGDLARYLPDGNIEYLDRIDNQVKIRGFRIELGEIEAVLSQHPNVREVAVIHREDTPGNKRLVAYVVSNLIPDRIPYHTECQLELNGNAIPIQTQDISTGGLGLVGVPVLDESSSVRLHLQLPGEDEPRWLSGTVVWSHSSQAGIRFQLTPSQQAQVNQSVAYLLDTQELWKTLQRTVSRNLRDYLKQKLPEYMIPSAFVLMKALPLTPNGKIDRRALPAPDNFHNEREDKFAAPHTPTEAKLAGIWAEVLGLEKISINDNFFELGGHSLQAAFLVSKLSVEMNLKISVKLLFQYPTIGELAEAIESLLATEPSVNRENLQAKVENIVTASLPKTTNSSPFFKIEQRSLLSLLTVGKIAPVDSAALGYLPLSFLRETSLTRQEILKDWLENLPMWDAVMETKWGRIAGLTLPIFEDELYRDQQALVQMVVEALEMAVRFGAKTVSLTGLIPSATDYGRAIAQAIKGRTDLPRITTGHATTCSAVVLTIKKILQVRNRSLEGEKVAFIGLGSIGINTLRLMLKCLPHPQSIVLCDIYSKLESIQNIQRELNDDLGFRGSVQIATSSSSSELPPEIYDATLIVGATNVPDILDIKQVKPDTLIVDDSGPHCFDAEQAIQRFEEQKDIWFTEGGDIQATDPIETVIYQPQWIKNNMAENVRSAFFEPTNPLNIMGCVMSSLLSSRFDDMQPTVGLPNLENCVQHYQGLERLGFQAADLHCEGYVLEVEPK
jgi:amino acid adenylation domain-containing protein